MLLRFERGGRAYVLRRGPRAPAPEEQRRACGARRACCARSPAPTCRTRASSPAASDETVMGGAVFYLMEPVDGFNPIDGPAGAARGRRRRCGTRWGCRPRTAIARARARRPRRGRARRLRPAGGVPRAPGAALALGAGVVQPRSRGTRGRRSPASTRWRRGSSDNRPADVDAGHHARRLPLRERDVRARRAAARGDRRLGDVHDRRPAARPGLAAGDVAGRRAAIRRRRAPARGRRRPAVEPTRSWRATRRARRATCRRSTGTRCWHASSWASCWRARTRARARARRRGPSATCCTRRRSAVQPSRDADRSELSTAAVVAKSYGGVDNDRLRDPRRKRRKCASACGSSCRTSASRRRRSCRARPYKEVLGELRTKARVAGAVVPVHPDGVRRHGPRPAGERARADGAGRELPRRARDEHAGPRRRDDADAAHARHRLPEGEVPQAAAQRREAHLLLDDGEGGGRRRDRHADARRPRRRQLGAQRREVVQQRRDRRRHRDGDGEDEPGRAAAPAVQHVPRRAAEPRLPDRPQHQDDGRREPRSARCWAAATPRSSSRTSSCRTRTSSAARARASTWASTGWRTGGCATACTTSRWRSARSTWRRSACSSARRSASRWPSARACSGCWPTARASCTSRG